MVEDKELDELMAKRQTEKMDNSDLTLPATQNNQNTQIIIPAETYNDDFKNAVGETQHRIIEKAKEKINDEKMIEKHSENLKKITDEALLVEAEKQRLIIEQVNADNKVVKQEIQNRLIVLKAEAKRLEKEQLQLNKEQKEDHKRRNKEAKWEIYKDKLTKMKYTYVPNFIILSMLLFFDGVVSFFNGLGAVSTAIMRAFKWILIIGLLVGVLFAIPVTREWLLSILG